LLLLLAGGLASVLLTALLIKFKIGLRPVAAATAAAQQAAAAAADGKGRVLQPQTPRAKAQRSVIYSNDGLSRKSDASVSFRCGYSHLHVFERKLQQHEITQLLQALLLAYVAACMHHHHSPCTTLFSSKRHDLKLLLLLLLLLLLRLALSCLFQLCGLCWSSAAPTSGHPGFLLHHHTKTQQHQLARLLLSMLPPSTAACMHLHTDLSTAPPAAAAPCCSSFVDDVGAVQHPPVATLDFPLTNAPASYPRRHSFAAQVDECMLDEELELLKASSPIAARGRNGVFSADTEHDAARHGATDAKLGAAAAAAAAGSANVKAMEEGTLPSSATAAAAAELGQVVASEDCSDHTSLAAAAAAGPPAPALGQPALLERLFSRKTSLPDPADQTPAAAAAASGSYSRDLTSDTAQLPLRRSPSGTMQLNPVDPAVAVKPQLTVSELLLRTLPIWLTVLVLLLTRIPAIPIKKVLQR
jgi:hypothetical protein